MTVPFREPSVPVPEPRDLRLRLISVRRETPDICSFEFMPLELETPLRFHPGQALTLQLQVNGEVYYRTFTIASSPTRPNQVTLTVKASGQGTVTNWMHTLLAVGDEVIARGPVGRFSLAWHHTDSLALISAGSGATPMISMLRWLADRNEPTDVAYVHLARRPDDLLFRAELETLKARLKLRVDHVVTTPDDEVWHGPVGRIDRTMQQRLLPDMAKREIFCCGPSGFMQQIADIHRAEGGRSERFHTETFGASAPEIEVARLAPGAGDTLNLTFGTRQFIGSAEATILQTAQANGIPIPTGCRNGICGTCRLQKLSGEVDMRHNGGLSGREEQDGMILACCAKPKTDLVLEVPDR